MELIYLWVEKYKNIKEEGFNLNSKFECSYNSKDKEFIIYPEKMNIFPSNINITAIVGENGSGKSTILELLFLPHKAYEKNDERYIVFFKKDKTIHYYSSFNETINSISDNSYKKQNISDFSKNGINVKYIAVLQKSYYDSIIRNKVIQTHEHYAQNMTYISMILIKSLKLFALNKSIILKNKNINFNKFKMVLRKIELFENVNEDIKKKYHNLIAVSNQKTKHKFDSILKIPNIRNLVINNIIASLINLYHSTDYLRNILPIFTKDYSDIDLDYIISLIDPENDIDICELLNLSKTFLRSIEENDFRILNNGSLEKGYTCSFEIKSKEDFLKEFITKYSVFISLFQESYFEFQMIDIDLLSDNNLTLSSFSDGEKCIYSKLIEFKYEFLFKKDNYILLLDEPDTFLHPNWTREFISILLDNIESNYKNIHLVITSHSPFILSDLPKDNIVFLREGKQVYPDIDTFGANIHTLLSHGFFMYDGLIGEFAKEKINQVYNFITKRETKYIKSLNEAQNIINIIGEPLIKRQLQELFNQTFEYKQSNLDEEINVLEKKLKALKDLKNDTN